MAFARRRLVRPDLAAGAGEDAFRFDHGLIRDAAYAAITKGERARLHERLARWLEERGELDEIVGHHLEQAALYKAALGEPDAGLAEEAAGKLRDAGRRALWAAAPAAVTLLSRAIALERDDERRLELELDLGTATKFAGDLPQAAEMLEIVASNARAARNRRIELRAEVELLWPRWSSGTLTGSVALELITQAIPVFEATSDDVGVARASHLEAAVQSEAGRGAEAEAVGGRALLFYRRAGFPAEFGSSLLAALLEKGPTPVDEAIRRCRELLGEIVTPGWRSFVLPPLACLEAMRGEFDIAREHLEDARLGRREWGEPGTLATTWAYQAGWVELLAGDPTAAETVLTEACEALREIGERPWLSTNLGLLATAVIEQGRFDDGLGLASEAASLALPDDQIAQILWRRAQAKALAAGGKLARADRLAREAVAIREHSDLLNDRAESLVVLADVLGLRGKTTEAAATLEKARTLFEAKGNVVAAERTRISMLALSG